MALVDGRADDVDIVGAVGIIELDDFPPIARFAAVTGCGCRILVRVGHVDSGGGEDLAHDCGAVGPVILERLAGPAAGHQGAAAAVAEVLAAVGFATAVASGDLAVSALGLDAVAEPVRALIGARQDTNLRVQPVQVMSPSHSGRIMIIFGAGQGLADRLGEVLAQVADHPFGAVGSTYHGSIQLVADLTGRSMEGQWIGFGKNFKINNGPWTLKWIDGNLSKRGIQQYELAL